eukprot:7980689-Ditylum_brightwellii.AAC.1
MDRYGQIKPADLVANGVRYYEQMDISQPIDVYFACIDDCIKYASDGNMLHTAKQALTTALHAMQRTGWFTEGIRAWRARNSVGKRGKILKSNLQQSMTRSKRSKRSQHTQQDILKPTMSSRSAMHWTIWLTL